MKKILPLFLFLMCSFGIYAQMINDSIAQICAYWRLGDSAVYQCYTYSEKMSEKGELQVKRDLSEKRIFQVTEMTDSTYTLKVTYDDVEDSTAIFGEAYRVAMKLAQSQFSDAPALVEFMQKYEKHLQEIHMQTSMEIRTNTLIQLNSGWTYACEYDKYFHVWDDRSES